MVEWNHPLVPVLTLPQARPRGICFQQKAPRKFWVSKHRGYHQELLEVVKCLLAAGVPQERGVLVSQGMQRVGDLSKIRYESSVLGGKP